MKNTKLVCTLGPASEDLKTIRQLADAGMNVARLNFSHGSHDEHLKKLNNVKKVAEELDRSIAVLQDISGPKIRVGSITKESINLKSGEQFILTSDEIYGDENRVSVNYKEIPNLVQKGDIILLADGLLQLEVVDRDQTNVITLVIVGGELRSHKGVNLPSRTIGINILSEKDRADLRFGLNSGVDLVALSFVRCAADADVAKTIMEEEGVMVPLIAKIEKPEAVANLQEIINAFDGVMVARGDLGVELPFEQLPAIQKKIISMANEACKPVITATQMLETMVNHPRPTRAEASDVANAILDGTDAVMLSEETAVGQYPVLAVYTMAKIAAETEKTFPYGDWTAKFDVKNKVTSEEIIARNSCEIAETIGVDAIFCATETGNTAKLISKYRPPVNIYAVTASKQVYKTLSLSFGVIPVLYHHTKDLEELLDFIKKLMVEKNIARAVVTGSPQVGLAGSTNLMLVLDRNTF
ncbi:MAG: pyruvate kinase [Kiritimatiellae bacterium]|jgi:pyruvate kinase|nr:pyruvate kinase [Kiritimatiellia bacterium]